MEKQIRIHDTIIPQMCDNFMYRENGRFDKMFLAFLGTIFKDAFRRHSSKTIVSFQRILRDHLTP